uniref:Uncharacterized protein n=1 Tax=Fagus sylvatica TaxID=28930 RepID=A0A2N9FBI3_FAGSY
MLNAWALDQLTKAEHFQRIIVEGDVKIYLASFNDISNEMQKWNQHHARLRRTTDPDLMTPAPPPCAPSSRRHQVAPMVLNSHLAITKLDLIDGSENWNGGSTTVVQAAT